MTPGPVNGPPAIPSRNALRVLRRLALAGSTVGSFCTVAAITYDVHRRVSVAERIVENKRALQTSAPRYDATSAARRLSRMMEAAEAGEFRGLEAWKEEERKFRQSQAFQPQAFQAQYDTNRPHDQDSHAFTMSTAETSTTAGFTSRTAASPEAAGLESKQRMSISSDWNAFHPPRPTLAAATREKYAIRQSDPDMDTPTVEDSLNIAPQEQLTLTDQLRTLVERHRLIDGAQVFLDGHPASLKGISSERRELVLQLFYLNCMRQNVFIARSIFERLEDIDHVSPIMWKILIVALARRGCVESAATIYIRYNRRFKVPHYMVDVVLRCLIESHRLTAAKWLLLRNLTVDRNCGLAGAYLTGLWRKTRNLELLNGQFQKLLVMFSRLNKDLTERLFNPMVKAYVEFGRFSDAEALVHDMTATYRVPLGCRTKGLLIFGKALKGDWTGVEVGLAEMRQLGLTNMENDFLRVFDRIFLEYWPTHTGANIQGFLYRHIDTFNIVPDDVLYKHIMEAIVEKGDEDMLSDFTSMARQRGWKVTFDEDQFLELLHNRRSELENSPVGFWQMLRAAREHNGRAATSRHLLGYDQGSFQPETVTSPDDLEFPMTWYKTTLRELTQPSRPIDQYQKLHNQMFHYMHSGKMAEALECYETAKNAGYEIKQLHFELAAIATLLEHGLVAAQTLLEDEGSRVQRHGRLPIFVRQIKGVDPSEEAECIKLAIFHFYNLCWWRRDMIVKHHISAATSRSLIASNKPEMALDMLVAVYTSKYGRTTAFDGVCMKMFLRAFAAVDNLAGIRWCMLTAFARDSALNQDFIVELYRVLGVLQRDFDSLSPGELPNWRELKKTSLWRDVKKVPRWKEAKEASRRQEQLRYLNFVAHRLGKKCAGQDFLDLRGSPPAKKSFRRALQRPMDGIREFRHFATLPQDVEHWDEEYELEKVLGRIDINEESILARWNEASCLEEMPSDEETTPPVAIADPTLSADSLIFSSATAMATLSNGHANGHANALPSKSLDAAEHRRRVHHDADIVIVGAGVLGCALAVALGSQGRSVLLLEMSLKEPDRIVGELLQPGGVDALEKLGLRDCLEGIEAIPTEGYYVSYYGRPVTIPYPVQNPGTPPPEGRSFHHGRFVRKLREAAGACPNVTMVETKVTDLITCSHTKQVLGVECVTKESKDCYFGLLTVVADGYASKFRKQYHPYTPKVRSKFWGLELIDAELPQPHYGHVLLNPDNPPILIYQIGTHETRILCDIPENLPSASVKNGGVKGHLRNVVLPSLPKGVQPSFTAALDKGQLRSMPNSFLPSATNKTPGLIMLGDALNMRHPLTGGGMTVALNDVVILRDLLSPENVPKLSNTALVLKQLSTFHWRRKMGASVVNVLAQALYSLFAANDVNLKALQRGCFEYFEIGMHKGPVSLLGGMLKKPQVLFGHFFTVAFLSLWMIIRDSPLYKLPFALVRCALVFWTACVVIFPYMLIEAFC
ncbi:squalene epoxidase-domain-containing protein [Aspergillus cavernicola]|uniref:squalene monooxygenase n=1 Tax=Aspergillus cavernicola TaxID=176166 RepID=A0ABR4HEY6_9EURO